MIWFRKTFGSTDWRGFQDSFESMFAEAKLPDEMLLVAGLAAGANATVIYAGFPDGTSQDALPGFEPISQTDLPKNAALVVGHDDVFRRHFRVPGTS